MTSFGKGLHILWIATLFLCDDCSASTKKGLAIANGKYVYRCRDEHVFTNAHWWYDWKMSPDWVHSPKNCTQPLKSGFVPMVWGATSSYASVNISENARYVLGFNEPDHVDQAHLTPAQAAAEWKILETKATGKILVGPAFTNIHWFDQFFQACHGCRIDHIATHIYSCDAAHVMNVLHNIWNRYHKPIWLTEFSCPHTTSADDQLNFMKKILPRLEAASYVFRYAWFTTRWLRDDVGVKPSTSLLMPHSAHFTPLGAYYNNFMH